MANSRPTNLYVMFLVVLIVPCAPGSVRELQRFNDVLASSRSWSNNHSCSSGSNITHDLPIIHRVSPWGSQKLRLNFTIEPRRYQAGVMQTDVDFKPKEGGIFLVVIGLGTPPQKNFEMLLDTGSSQTWLQCAPCDACFSGQMSFNTAGSSTYRAIPYTTEDRRQLRDKQAGQTESGDCLYKIDYADGDFTMGIWSSETLTLESTDVTSGFQFGCGYQQVGENWGAYAGVVGFGGNPQSLLRQIPRYDGIFSYCLPPVGSPGYLRLGEQARVSSDVKFTPMKIDRQGHFQISLTKIIVAGHEQVINPAQTMIVDSGTPVTRLPPRKVFKPLNDFFRSEMKRYKVYSIDRFQTCYDPMDVNGSVLPTIELHFKGPVIVRMTGAGIMTGVLDDNGKEFICLTFISKTVEEPAMLGSYQQSQKEVVFDLQNRQIGFGDELRC